MATAKGARRRSALIDAAATLVDDQGLDAVTHRAVAARADVPLAATTYYFASLDDLRRAGVEAAGDRALRHMQAVVDSVPVGHRSLEETARTLVDAVMPVPTEGVLSWYEQYARSGREPLLRAAAARANAAAREHVATVLERSGHPGPADPGPRETEQAAERVEPVLRPGIDVSLTLAVIDGTMIGAFAEGADAESARTAAVAQVRSLLALLAPGSREEPPGR